MYQMSVDTIHNKLVLTLHQNMTISDFYDIDNHFRRVVPQMEPDFTVITDLSRFNGLERFPADIFRRTTDYLKENEVGQVIRVIGKSRIGLVTFAQHTVASEKYNVIYVPTIKEALKYLPTIISIQ